MTCLYFIVFPLLLDCYLILLPLVNIDVGFFFSPFILLLNGFDVGMACGICAQFIFHLVFVFTFSSFFTLVIDDGQNSFKPADL